MYAMSPRININSNDYISPDLRKITNVLKKYKEGKLSEEQTNNLKQSINVLIQNAKNEYKHELAFEDKGYIDLDNNLIKLPVKQSKKTKKSNEVYDLDNKLTQVSTNDNNIVINSNQELDNTTIAEPKSKKIKLKPNNNTNIIIPQSIIDLAQDSDETETDNETKNQIIIKPLRSKTLSAKAIQGNNILSSYEPKPTNYQSYEPIPTNYQYYYDEPKSTKVKFYIDEPKK